MKKHFAEYEAVNCSYHALSLSNALGWIYDSPHPPPGGIRVSHLPQTKKKRRTLMFDPCFGPRTRKIDPRNPGGSIFIDLDRSKPILNECYFFVRCFRRFGISVFRKKHCPFSLFQAFSLLKSESLCNSADFWSYIDIIFGLELSKLRWWWW